MRTRRHDRLAVSATLSLAAVAGLTLVASTANAHDEDWRKLADKLPPVFGPVWSIGDRPVTAQQSGDLLQQAAMFDASGVSLYANIPVNNFGLNSTESQDCWGYVSPTGREYAIITLSNGYGFVEITDPANPVVLGGLPAPSSPWHDVKVVGEYAYGVSEGGGGIQVMDLRNIDGQNPGSRISTIGNFQTSGHTTTHNIIVNLDSDALYVCGTNIGNGGLFRVNIDNPEQPSIQGGWTDFYVHDAQVITPTSGPFAGREIAFCASGLFGGGTQTGLRIVDMTNPANPQLLSTLFYPNSGYSHQVWLADDGVTLYLNDELDEQGGQVAVTTTRIINVADLTNPQFVGTFTSGRPSIDHNLYVDDGYIYQANYRSGLRVFDAVDPLNPVEIAFFDTFPGSDTASFNGAWSVYPFFPSDTVIISDIERGLFVVEVTAIGDRLILSLTDNPIARLSPEGGETIAVEIAEQGLLVDPSTVEMVVLQDGAQTVIDGALVGGDLFEFTFPGAACGSEVNYFFRATSQDGQDFTLPSAAPTTTYTANVVSDVETTFADNFQQNLGWTVTSNVTDGAWERGIPSDDSRGAPGSDFDGSGFCYVTDNAPGNSDVDAGFTRLISPEFDLTGGGAISFAYWLNDIAGGPLSGTDNLVVQVRKSPADQWIERARFTSPAAQWRPAEILVDAADAGPNMQVRFTVSDNDPQGVVEAGIDAFDVSRLTCDDAGGPCNPADLGVPLGVLDLTDVDAFVAAFNAGSPDADIAAPFGVIDLTDIDGFIAAFLAGCP